MSKNKLYNNRGITGIDLTISIIALTTFTGIIITLMINNYRTSIEIQKSANAMSYATIILEKVDEKAYDKVTNDFLKEIQNEINIDSEYEVEFNVTEIENNDYAKKVDIKVSYTINNQKKQINIGKLKVKEI
mgnify:CR=1 FL=1